MRASTSVTAKRRSGERRAKRRLNSSDSSSMSPRPTRSSAFSRMPSREIDTSGQAPSTWAITQVKCLWLRADVTAFGLDARRSS